MIHAYNILILLKEEWKVRLILRVIMSQVLVGIEYECLLYYILLNLQISQNKQITPEPHSKVTCLSYPILSLTFYFLWRIWEGNRASLLGS